MKQNRDVPTRERGAADPGGGDDDQSLVRRRVFPKGICEPRKHGEIEGIDEGHNEKTRVGSEFGTAFNRKARSADVSIAITTHTQANKNPATPRVRRPPRH